MSERSENDLVHSVAFRVTEAQWLKLKQRADQEGTTVPQIAKTALFEKIGLEAQPQSRSSYGQKSRQKLLSPRGGARQEA
jgi:hypothetical protein